MPFNAIRFPSRQIRYQFLAFDFDETVDITGENCRLLLLRLKLEGWMVSHSKVFLKHYSESFLARYFETKIHVRLHELLLTLISNTRMYEEQVRKIVKVQAIMRAVLMKLKKKRGIDITQYHGRRRSSRGDLTKDEAAIAIQKSN